MISVRDYVDELSSRMISSVGIDKLADKMISPCMEKQAKSGIGAFGEALSGSKVKRLKGEVKDLSDKLEARGNTASIRKAKQGVKDVESQIEGSSVHDRMSNVRDNLDQKRDMYNNVSRANDDTLNHYTGVRTLLRPFSPRYLEAKGSHIMGKLRVGRAQRMYDSQERRLKSDLYNDLSHAKRKFSDAEKESGIGGVHDEITNKTKELEKARSQTSSARTTAAVGAAGAAGLAAYKYKQDNPSPGPYTYDSSMYSQAADEIENTIEKIAEQIMRPMIKK